jgi:uncharacterized membrane protein
MSALVTERRQARPATEIPRPEPHGLLAPPSSLAVHRAISVVAVLGLFAPVFAAWNDVVAVPTSAVVVMGLFLGALWLVMAFATARNERELAGLERWLLVLGLLALAAWTAVALHLRGTYFTDEAALTHGAADQLLHGHDPYGSNLLSALNRYSTFGKYLTHTMNGGIVSTFGYPAVSLLVVTPFVFLMGGGQAIPIANLFVLMIATVIVYRALPAGWRSLAVVLCVGFPTLDGFAASGVNAIIAMAFLLVAAYRWTATGQGGRLARGGRLRAVALGLALGTNPIGWFIAPFLIAGIYLVRSGELGRRSALRVIGRYVGLALATFLAVNLPFIIWGPMAWVQGVAAPVTQHAIPYGQGLVGLTLFLRIGGGALDAYNYAAAALYGALLVLYVAYFRKLGRTAFVLPLFALFVSGRSLAEYWMTMIAVLAIGSLTADDDAIRGARPLVSVRPVSPRVRRAATCALFLPALLCLAVALGTPAPLSMRILSAHSDPRLRSVVELRLLVENRSARPLRPHYATNVSGQAIFWNIRTGPAVLAAHRAAIYVLAAPHPWETPINRTQFVVEAYTASPRTISSTTAFAQKGPVPGWYKQVEP